MSKLTDLAKQGVFASSVRYLENYARPSAKGSLPSDLPLLEYASIHPKYDGVTSVSFRLRPDVGPTFIEFAIKRYLTSSTFVSFIYPAELNVVVNLATGEEISASVTMELSGDLEQFPNYDRYVVPKCGMEAQLTGVAMANELHLIMPPHLQALRDLKNEDGAPIPTKAQILDLKVFEEELSAELDTFYDDVDEIIANSYPGVMTYLRRTTREVSAEKTIANELEAIDLNHDAPRCDDFNEATCVGMLRGALRLLVSKGIDPIAALNRHPINQMRGLAEISE